MSILELPVTSDSPSYDFQVELEGTIYTLQFDWNDRASQWSVSILTSDLDPIVTGVPMNVELPLLGRFTDTRLPPGILLAKDTSNQFLECGRDDLGERVSLIYQESTGP